MKINKLQVECTICKTKHELHDKIEYETYVTKRSLDDEVEHIFSLDGYKCKCDKYLTVSRIYWEYPTNYINHNDNLTKNCIVTSIDVDQLGMVDWGDVNA
jgi:hypothetical protein